MKRDKIKYNISKELFETVMGIKTLTYSIEGRKNSKVIVYSTGYIGTKTSTVNDFFFKCKEWALEQGYELILDSEHQAVFDTCEQILKQTKNN